MATPAKKTPAKFRHAAMAVTIPSPWWWFLLSGVSLKQIEAVAGYPLIPAGLAYRGPLYVHAGAEFPWGIVREDALGLIRELGWRRTPAKWPSMYDMRACAGQIVGEIVVGEGPRGRGLSISPVAFRSSAVVCADGAGLFALSPAVVARIKTGVAA